MIASAKSISIIAGAVGSLLAFGSAPAAAADAADPFAAEVPLSAADLSEARGGLVIAGFIVEFDLQTLLTLSQANGAGTESQMSFGPEIDTLLINNALDGVAVTRSAILDVFIPNFDTRLDQGLAASVGAAASNSAVLGALTSTPF
jgi:hypothetical protein